MKDTKKDTQKTIQWAAIVKTLEVWRRELNDPSVTTIAEYYAKSAWAVLASTILSLRTKDAVTLEASKRLLAKAASPAALLKLEAEEIEKLIYPAGFYKTKAGNLLKIARILIEKYAGKVPADINTLLELPGVGRKTANLVCIEAFDMDGICVDTHVHRISNRMGWVLTKMPDDTEAALREILPRQFWKPINPLLVLFGQNVCKPIGPKCSTCPVSQYCEKLIIKH
ncbi:MAG: endonuclease III [Spirochaetaceae bacterium]|jgi:endonuclease-3|nr:endonuclease III [Spirochaetaceae bacterium]